MTGGFAGEESDPRDQGMHEAIIIRSDSTAEFYRNDTLLSRSSFRVIKEPTFMEGKELTFLEFTKAGENPEAKFTITVDDLNHLWYSQSNLMDGFSFLYVRYR